MDSSIFKIGRTASFSKRSRVMAKILSFGAGVLAVIFCLFIHFYFDSTFLIKNLSIVIPFLYLGLFFLGFSKLSNKLLYNAIFGVFIITSIVFLYIAYSFSFDSEYVILMFSVFCVILFAIPTTKQLLIYFSFVFIVLEIALNLTDSSFGYVALITVSFGAVFILSYMISIQKSKLNKKDTQNAKILKILINKTNDSIFLVDFYSGMVKDANENTIEIFGLNIIDDLMETHFHKLFTNAKFVESRKNRIKLKIEENGFFQADAMFKRKDGTNFLGRLHLSPFEALGKTYYLLQIKNIAIRKL